MCNNNHRSIGKLIDIISRNIKQIITHEVAEDCIGPGQYHYLHIIYRNEGISQKELVEMMRIHKANVTRGILRLEKNGYLRREHNSRDSRLINLFLTEKGTALIPRLKTARCRITDICMENLTKEEIEQLFILLEKVKDSVTKHNSCCKKDWNS